MPKLIAIYKRMNGEKSATFVCDSCGAVCSSTDERSPGVKRTDRGDGFWHVGACCKGRKK